MITSIKSQKMLFLHKNKLFSSSLTQRLVYLAEPEAETVPFGHGIESVPEKDTKADAERLDVEKGAVEDRTGMKVDIAKGEVEERRRMLEYRDQANATINEWKQDPAQFDIALKKINGHFYRNGEGERRQVHSFKKISKDLLELFPLNDGDREEQLKGIQMAIYEVSDPNDKRIDGKPGRKTAEQFSERFHAPYITSEKEYYAKDRPLDYSGTGKTAQERKMWFAENIDNSKGKEIMNEVKKTSAWHIRQINKLTFNTSPEKYNVNDWALILKYRKKVLREGNQENIDAFNKAVQELDIQFDNAPETFETLF